MALRSVTGRVGRATEREVIEWFLDAVNQRDERDPSRQKVAQLLASNRDSALRHSYAVKWSPVLATATGALSVTAELSPGSRGQMAMTYTLKEWNQAIASKGVEAFALSLLLDETRSHLDHLGQCQFCGKYFLAPEQAASGSKATGYCTDECRENGTRQKTLERVRKSREKARRKR